MNKSSREIYKIAHISDFHCGSQYFVPHLMERVITEVNEAEPDIVMVTGDLTEQGFKAEYQAAKAYLDQINCENVLVVPGNHDSRNVGYVHFEDFFGPRDRYERIGPFDIVCIDSSEPDIDQGKVGREKYQWISSFFSKPERIRAVVFHHHLVPIPGTGRERNILLDAGDFLKVLTESSVNIVFAGHRHVPNVWRFENILVINAGTVSTTRVRGYTEACYNLIEFDGKCMSVYRKIPFKQSELILSTNRFEGFSCSVPFGKESEKKSK